MTFVNLPILCDQKQLPTNFCHLSKNIYDIYNKFVFLANLCQCTLGPNAPLALCLSMIWLEFKLEDNYYLKSIKACNFEPSKMEIPKRGGG